MGFVTLFSPLLCMFGKLYSKFKNIFNKSASLICSNFLYLELKYIYYKRDVQIILELGIYKMCLNNYVSSRVSSNN